MISFLLFFFRTNYISLGCRILAIVFCSLTVIPSAAQRNSKPRITGQRILSIQEDYSIVVGLNDLTVEDDDDRFYPWGFSLSVYPGNNYTVSGTTVTPSLNFEGILTVQVTVNDGRRDSDNFDLKITVNPVNDPPRITGQQALNVTAGSPINLALTNLTVSDPDDIFPQDFTLAILNGNGYTVSGNQVTPNQEYVGNLTVSIKVNDGHVDSQIFNLNIAVAKRKQAPVITNQKPIVINEDESFTLTLDYLIVADDEGVYPKGFSLHIADGDYYSLSDKTIIPDPDFYGNIFCTVKVSQANLYSNPFKLQITVRAVNDAPIIALSTDSLRLKVGQSPIQLIQNIEINDVDNDSLNLAEIAFDQGAYDRNTDHLRFNSEGRIKGIFDSQNGILALIGKASIAEYKEAIQSIQLDLSVSNTSISRNKTLLVNVNDGVANSNRVEIPIVITDSKIAFEIPTGFTPNGDMINDTWSIRISNDDIILNEGIIKVYTKSGQLVYESTEFTKEWDGRFNGKMLPVDVYFYTIEINIPAGQEEETMSHKGIVTILR